MTFMPKDFNDQTIPALRLKDGGAQSIAFGAAAAANAAPFDPATRVVGLYATAPVFVKFGVSDTVAATAGDHFIPAGIYLDVAIGGGSNAAHLPYVSALQADTAGTLYISEKI